MIGTSLRAFHNDEKIKHKYLNRVREHRLADEIIKGQYWESGKGCAVGCTIHGSNHKDYESELGIPEWLARLEDTIFENLPNERAKIWPEEFLDAIHPGADLEKVKTPFLIFILEDCLVSLDQVQFDRDKFPDVSQAICLSQGAVREMIRCHREGLDLSAAQAAIESASWAARSAAWASESAESSAARSASWAAAASAESAALAASWAARSAAWAASWAARSAAWAAAASAARAAAFEKYADKLLELLREAK